MSRRPCDNAATWIWPLTSVPDEGGHFSDISSHAGAIAFARGGVEVAPSFIEGEMPAAEEVAKLIEVEGRKVHLAAGRPNRSGVLRKVRLATGDVSGATSGYGIA